MFIGDVLVARGLATPDDLSAGRDLQRTRGGGLGDCLVELGRISREDLETVYNSAPPAPRTLAEVGAPVATLLGLLLKMVYAASVETVSEVADLLLLPPNVVADIFEEAENRQLLAVVGAVRADLTSERRYALTKSGLEAAQAAMARSEYIGPAPVSLDAYRAQIRRQAITHEHAEQAAIEDAFKGLVVSQELFVNLGPAINSGRSILLYGPPGNGKTTIANRIGTLFKDVVYVPPDWKGKMPDGDPIDASSTFFSIRSKYKDDPSWSKVKAYIDGGPAPTLVYHRFWAQAQCALAYATYGWLFPK